MLLPCIALEVQKVQFVQFRASYLGVSPRGEPPAVVFVYVELAFHVPKFIKTEKLIRKFANSYEYVII